MSEPTVTWLFAYGSLVSPQSLAETIGRTVDVGSGMYVARLNGWGRRWNYGSLRMRGSWTHDGVAVDHGLVVSLGVVAAPAEHCIGTVFAVRPDELARLDHREADYHRLDVTDRCTVENGPAIPRIEAYIPNPSSIARYEAARDDDRAAIRRSYWDLVHDAYAALGADHGAHMVATPQPDIPVADIVLASLPPAP